MIGISIWKKCGTNSERSCSCVASSCHLDVPEEVVALRGNFVVSKGILQKDLLVGCNGEAHVFLVASRPSGLCLVGVVFLQLGGVGSLYQVG